MPLVIVPGEWDVRILPIETKETELRHEPKPRREI